MTATIHQFSLRTSAGGATDPGSVVLPPVAADPVERFPRILRPSGLHEWLTPYGAACRFNGHWHVARDGAKARPVTNPELIAALDANERAS